MQEELISFETAKLAKEKKFNEPCQLLYQSSTYNLKGGKEGDIFANNIPSTQIPNTWYLAPTQSLLQRWLREIHNIHLVCWWYDKENKFYTELGRKEIDIIRVQTGDITKLFDTYEQALEAGLQKGLKLIKL